MKYKIHNEKKLIVIEKQFFTNLHIQDITSLDFILNSPSNYSILIMEIGESTEAIALEYLIFLNALKKFNITNEVFVLTETEIESYFNWIKSIGWIPITYYGFFSYNPDIDNPAYYWCHSEHIPRWLVDKPVLKKETQILKKFFTLNRRGHQHRIDLFEFLKENNLLKDSYASFRYDTSFDNNFNQPITDIEDINNIQIHRMHHSLRELYDSSFLFIITESRVSNHIIKVREYNCPDTIMEFESDYFTEKTTKTIAANIPFVLIGPAGILKRLHKLGFKTFGEFWDESYDDEIEYEKRFNKVKEIINWVASKDLSELTDIYNKMIPIFEHNKQVLKTIKQLNEKLVLKHIPTFFD